MASHMVLNEMGIKFDLEQVTLSTHTTKSGSDYYKINPKGYVPALTMSNGELLTEVSVVLQYLADQKPEINLIPKAGTLERYRCQEWLTFVSTELHKNFSPLFRETTPEETRTSIKNTLAKRFELLTTHLKTNHFLMGAQYTVADAYLFTILRWSHHLKVDLTPYPALMGYVERVKARPATMVTLKNEGLLK
mgnify:CR=1 FL=1